jgi:excisionase family DNA binding protein
MKATQILNVKDAAEFVGLKPATIYALVSARRIPFLKIGRAVRFDSQDLTAWLESKRIPAIF